MNRWGKSGCLCDQWRAVELGLPESRCRNRFRIHRMADDRALDDRFVEFARTAIEASGIFIGILVWAGVFSDQRALAV